MTTENGSRIGACLLAVILLSATLTRVTFAADPASGVHDSGGSNRSAEPSGSRSPRHVKPSLKTGTAGIIHARRRLARGAPEHVERNAIGLPVAQHEGPAQISGREAPGIAEGARGLAKTDGGLDRPTIARPSATPIVGAPLMQRGAITGTGPIRRSSSPSGLGGPAKVAAGINGTKFRPKGPRPNSF